MLHVFHVIENASNVLSHYRDVHIINVHQTSVDPAVDSRSEVVVDVRTVGGVSVQRDLVLVLNGHSKMKWNILTENVDGSLEVLVSSGKIFGIAS